MVAYFLTCIFVIKVNLIFGRCNQILKNSTQCNNHIGILRIPIVSKKQHITDIPVLMENRKKSVL